MADTFGFGFYGCFQHIGVGTFGKYHALRIAAGGVVKLTGEFAFVTHQFAELYAVSIPVFDVLAGYTTFHGCTCYGAGHFGDKARVNRFRDEVFRAETEVVYVVSLVHNIGYRLFCQISDSVYSGNLHFLVDGFSLSIQGTAEDIGETDYVINLVRIVRTSGCHQYVGTG